MKRTFAIPALALSFALLAAGGCTVSSEDPEFDNPFDPDQSSGISAPTGIMIAVGDNVVRLSWTAPEDSSPDQYAVFRRRTDPAADDRDERLLERISETSYLDTDVRNGRAYAYRLASGIGGQFGLLSEAIDAQPGLFTILIENDDTVTSDRSVSISLNATGAEALQISEDVDVFDGPWRPASGSTNWTLSSGDGEKTVYVQFRFPDTSTSMPVFDTIDLDTRAEIGLVSFEGSEIRSPGETIHFRVETGETSGSVTVDVQDVFDTVPLFDDGTSGDDVADDGIYQRDLIIPVTASAREVEAEARFTDEAGNEATPVTASRLLTVLQVLQPIELVDIRVAELPDPAGLTVSWSRSLEDDFSAYRVYRALAAPVDSTSDLVGSVSTAATLEYEDTDVVEGLTYFYRVYVQDDLGRSTGSNMRSALVPNVRPPAAVTIESSSATSTSRIALAWSQSADRDFAAYRVHRNETGAVSDADPMVAELTEVSDTFFDDVGLVENTAYYYRVYTVDTADLTERSNEVEVKTGNEPPIAVVLNTPADVDTSSATLSWSESDVHDFASYKLHRDEIPTVTPGSPLVVELDGAEFTTFRDTELEPETTYYYRVFVVDDADDPESTGSNTVTATTD
jgi:hypothetical protein